MSEWLKEHAWKVCILKGIEGSNPFLSAKPQCLVVAAFYFMAYIVYILYSPAHDRFYTGQTDDTAGRLLRHNNGYEKATAPYVPWVMKCFIQKATRGEAMVLEKKIKNLNREKLLAFIAKYR